MNKKGISVKNNHIKGSVGKSVIKFSATLYSMEKGNESSNKSNNHNGLYNNNIMTNKNNGINNNT